MAKQTNYDHLTSLEPYDLGAAILRIADNACSVCRANPCKELCPDGIALWLCEQYSQNDPIWEKG